LKSEIIYHNSKQMLEWLKVQIVVGINKTLVDHSTG